MVYPDEIREWSQHTVGGFELIEVDGDHWFLNRNRELITATLQEIAAKVPARRRPITSFAGGRRRTRRVSSDRRDSAMLLPIEGQLECEAGMTAFPLEEFAYGHRSRTTTCKTAE